MENWVTLLRSVGDVLGIRIWFRPTCLGKLIQEIYRDIVQFDMSNDGESCINKLNGLEFFDFWDFVGWEQTNIFLVTKSDLYAVSGIGGLLANKSFPDTARA